MKKLYYFISISLLPAVIFASEGGGHSSDGQMSRFFWRVIVFAVFAFILVKLLKKPMSDFLEKRTADIQKALNDALDAKRIAEQEMNEYKSKVNELQKELDVMKERASAAAETEKNRIIAEAEESIEKLKKFSEALIASDINRAKEELKKETFILSSKLAEKKIKDKLSESGHDDIVNEYVGRIGAA